MGGGKGGDTSTAAIQSGELANSTALTQIAQQQSANAQQLFGLTEPGLATAENFYSTLATGDPGAIMRAIAPAAQQSAQAAAGSRANIEATSPAGGEKNLALEMTQVNQGAQVGQAATGAYLNAPASLASLAGQTIPESTAAAGTGVSGLNAANQGLYQAGNLGIEQKGAQLGALSSLGGDAATIGAAAILAP